MNGKRYWPQSYNVNPSKTTVLIDKLLASAFDLIECKTVERSPALSVALVMLGPLVFENEVVPAGHGCGPQRSTSICLVLTEPKDHSLAVVMFTNPLLESEVEQPH